MFLYNYIIHPIEIFYKVIYLMLAEWLGGYGIAIIALSFLSFVLLYPFTRKAYQIQQEESHLQGILQGQLREIKEKYTGAEQFEKIQRLYGRYSYHPIMTVRSVLGLLIQLPFLLAMFYMLSNCTEIQGVSWGTISNLGKPDALLYGINILPLVMTFVSVVYAYIIPDFNGRQKVQTIIVSIAFLLLFYSAPSALLVFWTCNIFWSLLDSVFSKKLKWVGEYITENELAFHVIFALGLTVGLLVPTEIYIKNANQLWFDYKDILKFFLVDTAKYIGILLLVYILCWWKKRKTIYLSILLGLLIGVFLQSYILGINYGLFDGHSIKWEEYTWQGIVNTFVWFFCLGVTIALFYRFNFDKKKLIKIIKPTSFCIIITQCLVLLFLLNDNPIQHDIIIEDKKAGILTTKNMFTISENENVVVFLLDAFDASVFEEIEKKNPELIADFKDFIYYPDTTSSFGYTYYSLPEILTGELYNFNGRYSDYIAKAWSNTKLYKKLQDNNFNIYLYTSSRYIYKNAPISNLVCEIITMDVDVADNFSKVVKFRLLPHYFKRLYYEDVNILDPKTLNNTYLAYKENDILFYNGIKNGLRTVADKNMFHFYHLNGLHQPFILNEKAEIVNDNEKSNYYKQALGVLHIVKTYISQIKNLNKYKNSVIAIIADHGHHNSVGSRPLFLIKPKNYSNEFLTIVPVPMTVANLLPLILSNYKELAIDKPTIQVKNDNRFFYYEDIENKRFLKYAVDSPANNINSWKMVEVVQKHRNLNRNYQVGEIIDFSFDGNSQKYKSFGWREKEDWEGTLINKDEAELLLDITNIFNLKNDLILKVVGSAYLETLPSRKVKIYVNDVHLGNFEFDNKVTNITCENTKNIVKIPKDIVIRQKPMSVRFLVERPDGLVRESEKELVVMIEKCQLIEDYK